MFALLVVSLLIFNIASGFPLLEGRYLPGGRIVGGDDANIADYPYQLALIFDAMGPFCGASLVAKEWALTAAHCVLGAPINNLAVRAGSTLSTSGGQLLNIDKIYIHQDFDYGTAVNDIALLKLASEVTAHNSKIIPLATRRPQVNKIATATGWGLKNEGDATSLRPEVLQVVQVPVIDQQDCRSAYATSRVTDSMLCAGYLGVGGKDACTFDSGGPLVVDGVLVGITSWGRGCARPDAPGVYTDVASFLDWIEEIIGSN